MANQQTLSGVVPSKRAERRGRTLSERSVACASKCGVIATSQPPVGPSRRDTSLAALDRNADFRSSSPQPAGHMIAPPQRDSRVPEALPELDGEPLPRLPGDDMGKPTLYQLNWSQPDGA